MKALISGLHHLTCICSDVQATVKFYRDVLGLRLVKQTVNFDQPTAHHLYFGDNQGHPGTCLTFFNFGEKVSTGRVGNGQVTQIAFKITPKSKDFWLARLEQAAIQVVPYTYFEKTYYCFRDPDGLSLALVESEPLNSFEAWPQSMIEPKQQITGFHGITLSSPNLAITADFLANQLGFKPSERFHDRALFDFGQNQELNLISQESTGHQGIGSIHHVAFKVDTQKTQLKLQQELSKHHRVTEIIDRTYFKSIYFQEPGGALLEVATLGPGFTIDESVEDLGTSLQLPPWLEEHREYISEYLPTV